MDPSAVFRTLGSYIGGLDSPRVREIRDTLLKFGRDAPHEPDFGALPSLIRTEAAQVVDVGANRGQSVRSLRLVLPSPHIVAFEPNPRLAGYIKRRYPSGVEVHEVALGRTTSQLNLYLPRYGRWSWDTRASLEAEAAEAAFSEEDFWRFDPNRVTVDHISVPVRALDAFELSPDLIKVDVEGRERAVIEGALATIARSRPVLLVEGDGAAVEDALNGLGYGRFRWDPETDELGAGPGKLNTFLLPA